MEIRAMSIQDYENVRQLWLATPGVNLHDVDDCRQGIASYLRRNPESCFVAVKDRRIIGAILAGHDGRRAYIYHAAVAAGERRQGIGTALLDAALAALERQGLSKAALLVFRDNDDGNRFWQRCGFSVREDLTYRNKVLNSRGSAE